MDQRIGAQYYTIRDFCKTLEDFDASCKKVAEIGYKLVQLSGIGDFKAEDIKTILDKYGLQAVCTHRPAQNYLENLEEEIAFHKTIGCKICGIGCMPNFRADEETINDFIRKYNPVCQELAKHNLVLGYHNHSFEFIKLNGKYIFDIINEGTDIQYILDVYWIAFAGIDPAKFIREHKGRIACVHFKDLKIKSEDFPQMVPRIAEIGAGNLDWDKIIAACEEADVPYALVEQDVCPGDPFDSLKISYDFLSKKGFQ